jgi:hypothetical protein
MTERLKEAIPGTHEHEATHGMTQGHRGAEQVKSYIPGIHLWAMPRPNARPLQG